MGGPFMVEIVFCRVTRRGRKKKAGMNKLLAGNTRNDGCAQSFVPPDTLKVTLDLSDTGPVFSALDEMMTKMSLDLIDDKRKPPSGDAKNALKKLLRSGIPGIEGMFGGEDPQPRFGKKGGKKGFHKMNEGSRKKFMNAIFGEEGTQIDSSTAAALLASTCSGGDPAIGNRLAELLIPEMDEKVDPAMMAALMSACSLIGAGAGTEEVMSAMKLELAASGLSEEEILHKTQLLMKAFGKEEVGSTAEYKMLSKQKNKALVKAELPPKDFTTIVLAHKAIAACGSSPENCAKILMIYSTLAKKGANMEHVAASMKNLAGLDEDKKADCTAKILAAWENPKFAKLDVMQPVRMHQALDNENEPGWLEVKNMKEIVGGVSPNSPEAIELNLARATKSGGLKKDDIGRTLMALKAIRLLGVDEVQLAKTMFLEKTICENGVPGGEVGRVLNDGVMPPEATASLVKEVSEKFGEEIKAADIECAVKIYNNLKFKSNIPTEVIEFVDKSLIQVRCSLEDVADNMISSLTARGEKSSRIISQVTEMLKKTGATACVTASTMMSPLMDLTGESECQLVRTIARNLKDCDYETDEVKAAVLEMILKILDDDPSLHAEACATIEATFKDLGDFPNTIKDFIAENLPPPPTPPEEVERRLAVAAEMERLTREEEERERLKNLKASDPEAYEKEVHPNKPSSKGPLDSLKTDSRRGSIQRSDSFTGPGQARSRQGSLVMGGTERRGSYYGEDVTTRASVAVVTDDPEHKKNLKAGLAGAFKEAGMGPVETGPDGVVTVGGAPLPPGTKIKNLPDGSVAVTDPEGNTIVPGTEAMVNGLGAVGTLPPGTKVEVGPGGVTTVGGQPLPPGAKVKNMPDGSMSITGPDGRPMGAPVAAGTLPPGTKVEVGPGGVTTIGGQPLPPGAKVKNMPDGSMAITGPDGRPMGAPIAKGTLPPGTQVEVGPGGVTTVGGKPLPPGAKVKTLPDGSMAITGPDGKIMGSGATGGLTSGLKVEVGPGGVTTVGGQPLPPGAQVSQMPDGSIVMTGPSGSVMTGSESMMNGFTGPAVPGALPLGLQAQVGPGGIVTVGGTSLPPGAKIQNRPDGSTAIAGVADLLASLPPDASDEEIRKKMLASGMSDNEIRTVMGALSPSGRGGISPESRSLMDQILRSNSSKDEISSRVAALLAGTALSSTRGMDRKNTEVEMVNYDAGNLSAAKGKKDSFTMPSIPRFDLPELREGTVADGASRMTRDSAGVGGVRMREHGGQVKRGSIKRQSEIIRERHKSRQEEREEERQRKASYFRKVTGLRRAKVPLMVYSCGGFSRCFRVARFYDVEGPPVGIEYDRGVDGRSSLNPEL